jgi:hypothetical protein
MMVNVSKPAYDPKDAVRHVVHDYVSLVAAGTDTQRGLAFPCNHYAERTFLVHCRAMAKFFSDGTDRRDVYARAFTSKPFMAQLPIWEKWADHIDKHIMHLTTGRITNKIPWTGEPNKCILEEFAAVWKAFRKELKGDLKPLFDKELAAHQKGFKDYPLILEA